LALSTIVDPDVSFMCQELTVDAAEAAEGSARRPRSAVAAAKLRLMG